MINRAGTQWPALFIFLLLLFEKKDYVTRHHLTPFLFPLKINQIIEH